MTTSDQKLNKEKLNNEREEKRFVKLFDEVLEKNRGNLSDDDIGSGIEEAINYFRNGISGSIPIVQYDKAKLTCGFFHRYSPLFAGIARSRILTALKNCEELKSIFEEKYDKAMLNIVDIGSAAGTALLGLYSALEGFDTLGGFDGGLLRSHKLTLNDHNKNWKPFWESILEITKRDFTKADAKIFNEKMTEWSYDFSDVKNDNLGDNLSKALTEADIVLMKGLITILENNTQRYTVCKKITDTMKVGAFLIILESPTYEIYFQDRRLTLVFTTRKYEPPSSSSSENDDSSSEGHAWATPEDHAWEVYNPRGTADVDDFWSLSTSAAEKCTKKFGRGLALISNQHIFVLKKTSK